MPRPTKKNKYIQAIRESRGLITAAARMLGVDRSAVYSMMRRHPEVEQALIESREEMLDFAEGKLYQNIANNDNTAIIFYLKTIGKNRGYVERVEQQHSGRIEVRPIAIEVVPPESVAAISETESTEDK